MDIYISQNNNETVIQLPVMPESFGVSLAQNNETFTSISQGDLKLIGHVGLKKISFSSFFPLDTDAPYVRNKQMRGYQFVTAFESFMYKRLPVRIVITETGINMPATIDQFDYSTGRSGDISYTMELSEFRFVAAKGVK